MTNGKPNGKIDMRLLRFLVGTSILLIFIFLTARLFLLTGGVFLATHWVVFYVLVALITGCFFWTFAGSSGEFTWAEFGGKLTGGAAIGMLFMLMAWKLTPTITFPYRVVTVEHPVNPNAVSFEGDGPADFFVLAGDGRRVLVEYRDGQKDVTFSINFLDQDKLKSQTYRVPRVGDIPAPVTTEIQ